VFFIVQEFECNKSSRANFIPEAFMVSFAHFVEHFLTAYAARHSRFAFNPSVVLVCNVSQTEVTGLADFTGDELDDNLRDLFVLFVFLGILNTIAAFLLSHLLKINQKFSHDGVIGMSIDAPLSRSVCLCCNN
jgi:hypothetical protein